MAVIAIDLGGTKLTGAIFNERGAILEKTLAPLEGRRGRAVGELICHHIHQLRANASARNLPIRAVGVSVPGISYSKTGKVWAPNIPGWDNYPLRQEITRALGSRSRTGVVIDSDRACYILGETWRGAAKGCRNAIFLAVGTGIGAGILCDGQVLRGAHDIAGAIGWLALDRPFRNEYVSCGCFEHHASGEGLAKVARELLARPASESGAKRPRPLVLGQGAAPTAREVFAAFAQGDPVAREVLRQAVEFWGMAVANLVSLFNPEQLIFGGGVFGPGKQFLADIYAEACKWAQPVSIQQVKLRASQLGPDAGLYGAARLALEN